MNSRPERILNADDFGKNERVNAAVVSCLRDHLCSSATIMPNMPGFASAAALVADNGYRNHVGLHLVLTEGVPLTSAIRRYPKFCDKDGAFLPRRIGAMLWLSRGEKVLLADEIRAQIAKCRKTGLPITHIDSHHNIHEELGLFLVLRHTMRESRIPFLRTRFNLLPARTFAKAVYTGVYNSMLRGMNLAKTRFCCSIGDYIKWRAAHGDIGPDESCEIMLHPDLGEEGEVVDSLARENIKGLVTKVDGYMEALSFSGKAL